MSLVNLQRSRSSRAALLVFGAVASFCLLLAAPIIIEVLTSMHKPVHVRLSNNRMQPSLPTPALSNLQIPPSFYATRLLPNKSDKVQQHETRFEKMCNLTALLAHQKAVQVQMAQASYAEKRYAFWHCTARDFCQGLGDRVSSMTTMFALALATDRALVVHHELLERIFPLELLPNSSVATAGLSHSNLSATLIANWYYVHGQDYNGQGGMMKCNSSCHDALIERLRKLPLDQIFTTPHIFIRSSFDVARVLYANPHVHAKLVGLGLRAETLSACLSHVLMKPNVTYMRHKLGPEVWSHLIDPDVLTIGVHIRMGDRVLVHDRTSSVITKDHVLLPIIAYRALECASQIESWALSSLNRTRTKVVFMTDHTSLKNVVLAISGTRLARLNVRPLHIDTPPENMKIEAAEGTAVEFFALSMCDFIIAASPSSHTSGFAAIAGRVSLHLDRLFNLPSTCTPGGHFPPFRAGAAVIIS